MAGKHDSMDCFPREWPLCRIGDFASVKGGKRLPLGATLVQSRTSHPYLRIVDFKDGRIDKSSLMYVPEDVFPSIAKYTISQKDIYISIVGTIGLVGVVDNDLDGANLTENAAKICNIQQSVDRDYLALFLRSHWGQHQMGALTVGSTQPKLALHRIEDVQVPLPLLPEQRAIAHILGTLDDKIELNRRMSETLEAMARAIFKSWFVDFEPVRAKAAVRREHPKWTDEQVSRAACPNLKPEIATLFPDSFVDSELGEIPKGWEVGTLGDVVEQLRDQENPLASPETLYQHFSIPAFDDGQWPREELGKTIKSFKSHVSPGVVLLSKLNPEIERVWLVDVQPSDRAVCSTEFLVLRPQPPAGRAFAYCLLRSPVVRQELQGMVTGTSKSHQRAQAGSILGLRAVRPPAALVQAFEQLAGAWLGRTLKCRRESRTLAALRDALLPKLISGEIRVKDAEKFLEERGL